MKFATTTKLPQEITCDLLAAAFFEGEKLNPELLKLDKILGGAISHRLSEKDFKGKNGETLLLFPGLGFAAKRLALLGLGKKNEYNLEKLRTAISSLALLVHKSQAKTLGIILNQPWPKKIKTFQGSQALVESLILGSYKFTHYKQPSDSDQPNQLTEIVFLLNRQEQNQEILKGAKYGEILANIVNLTRDLGNHPANVATPSHLAEHALRLARESKKIKVKILNRAQIKKEKMEALLAVAQGSAEEPKFIILEYLATKKLPTVVLTGKGITFDSGGISIKPSERLEEMKFDMAGAATVMGIIQAASALSLRLNLIGLIPATENLPSGKALKPGDIIRSRSGKTIEIINTDAEGRVILADALDYAKKYQPDLVLNFATLTGALAMALGDELIGAFTNRPKLIPKLQKAAETTGEKICFLPLDQDYEQFLKSDFADVRNIGSTRSGDTINAALFLEKFTSYPWIHLDIASVAWTTREKPYRPKGATGTSVRLAIEFLKNFKK
jgi:leucyl aminopeptidase